VSVEFKPSYVHQGHYVEIDGEFTGIVVNLYAYETIDEYKKQVDEKINKYKAELWWNSLGVRAKWDLFFKYNPKIADAPASIGLDLNNINSSHVVEIWCNEFETL